MQWQGLCFHRISINHVGRVCWRVYHALSHPFLVLSSPLQWCGFSHRSGSLYIASAFQPAMLAGTPIYRLVAETSTSEHNIYFRDTLLQDGCEVSLRVACMQVRAKYVSPMQEFCMALYTHTHT